MEKVTTSFGAMIDYDAAVNLMDDEIREELHHLYAPCTPQEFYDAYCESHEATFGTTFVCDDPSGQW